MDRGRFVTSGNRDELFAFRTVTLRQVGATAPYMHDGALETLADVIEFYDRGGGDEETIPEDRIDAQLVPLGLSAQEKAQLEAFLLALTDPTMEVRVPERVPSGLPPAGLELQQEGASVSSMTAQESLAAAPSSMAWAARVSSFPNPFNAETNIAVDLGQAGKVDPVPFDLPGSHVRPLAQGIYPAASHLCPLGGRGDDQRPAAPRPTPPTRPLPGTRRTSRLTLLR